MLSNFINYNSTTRKARPTTSSPFLHCSASSMRSPHSIVAPIHLAAVLLVSFRRESSRRISSSEFGLTIAQNFGTQTSVLPLSMQALPTANIRIALATQHKQLSSKHSCGSKMSKNSCVHRSNARISRVRICLGCASLSDFAQYIGAPSCCACKNSA